MSKSKSNTNDFQKLLDEYLAWNVYHDEGFYSIRNMSTEDLCCAILEDIMMVTFWEKDHSRKVNFTYETLVRFIEDKKDLELIRGWYETETVQKYLSVDANGQVRFKNDRVVEQAAMNYIGVWADGYDIPEGTNIIRVNSERFDEEIEKHGSLNNLATALSMELEATVPSSSTFN